MKAILGRLSDLGLRELSGLLTSAGAEGSLEVETPAGPAQVDFRAGDVAGQLSPALVLAFATRSGTFCFRPRRVAEAQEWLPQEEFLARLESQAQAASRAAALSGMAEDSGAPAQEADPLAELRDSLAEVPLQGGAVRVLVISADPRPYRQLAPKWRPQGWDVTVADTPSWPDGVSPALVIVHLPVSGTLGGHSEAWLDLVKRAGTQRPPAPVIWVGGLGDPSLRHRAIMAGVEFMMPAPASEVGETARWFREELGEISRRLMSRRGGSGEGAAEAFRDFFLALHVDATPAEARASLLRFAATFFGRGVLFAIRDAAFESVGGYGFTLATPVRVSRGNSPLEDVVVERRPLRLGELSREAGASMAKVLQAGEALEDGQVFPILSARECTALFIGDRPLANSSGVDTLATVLARSGSLLDL
ncbi:MAG: hypothetical protein ACHQQS_07140 [Thermoanaerobaculales bacterium]